MNHFDLSILRWVNQFSQRSYLFDLTMTKAAALSLVKGMPYVLALGWLWLAKGAGRERRREIAISTTFASVCAIAVGRLMATALPFRVRPVSDAALHFVAPYTFTIDYLRSWSAFPSDHAMWFATLATGFWFASPVLGLLAHAYGAIVVGIPRVYLGLHHPTDLIAGAAVGIVIGIAANLEPIRRRIAYWPLKVAEQRPTLFSLIALAVAFQMATMWEDTRSLMQYSGNVIRSVRSGDPTKPPPDRSNSTGSSSRGDSTAQH